MKYNPEIWSDLDQREKLAYHIYEEFQRQYDKFHLNRKWLPQANAKSCYNYDRDGKYPGDKIRESKHWQHFIEICDIFENYSDFEPSIFIDAIFRSLRPGQHISPAQLKTKRNIKIYEDYRMKMKMGSNISDEKRIMQDVANSYKYIKKKIKKDELNAQELYKFFNNIKDNNVISEGIKSCILEMISPFYFCLSKSFRIAYNNSDKDVQDEIISIQKMNNIASFVKLKTIAYSFIKKLYGDDIL